MYGYHIKELRVREVRHDGDVTGLDVIGHESGSVEWTKQKQGTEGSSLWQTEQLNIRMAGHSKVYTVLLRLT